MKLEKSKRIGRTMMNEKYNRDFGNSRVEEEKGS